MTKTTPTDLQARMEKLVRDMAERSLYALEASPYDWWKEATSIVAELPKPTDPDVLAVREMLAAWHFEDDLYSSHLLSGAEDDKPDFLKALEAYRRIKADGAPARFRGGI